MVCFPPQLPRPVTDIRLLKRGTMVFTLACAFLACTQPLPTAPDAAPLLAQASGDITVAYECGNTFVFRNRSLDTMTLSWRVRGVHEEGTVFLPARPAAGEFSEIRVTTNVQGPLQVFRAGRELQTVPNGHGPACTAHEVPDQPPDSVPAWVTADSNLLATPDFAGLHIPRNVVSISFVDGATSAQKQAAFDSVQGELVGGRPLVHGGGFYLVRIPGDSTGGALTRAIEVLSRLPQVFSATVATAPISTEWVRPTDGTGWTSWNVEGTPGGAANWGLEAVQAPLAWGCDTDASRISLAVVDHGFFSNPDVDVNATHSELLDRFPIADDHGGEVASVAAARAGNGIGIAGMAPYVDLRRYEGGADATGQASASQLDAISVANALDRAARDGAKVINLSWGIPWERLRGNGYVPRSHADSMISVSVLAPFRRTVFQLEKDGIHPLYVIAAGQNSANDFFSGVAILKDNWPGNVLVVGGVELKSGEIVDWSHSNRGLRTTVLAPAVNVGVISSSGLNTTENGTSFAAPLVSGLAALVLSENPSFVPESIAAAVDSGALSGGRLIGGVPLVNAYQTLKYVARTHSAPLCGNRMAIEGRTVVAERAPGDFESLATISGTSRIDHLLTFHGGRKFVIRNEGDDKVFELQPDGSWTGPQLWNGDSTGLTGSAVSQYGEDHDRTGVYHTSGVTLWKGRTFWDFTTPVVTLPTPVSRAQSDADVCIRQFVDGQNEQCQQTINTASDVEGYWRPDATTLGDTELLLSQEVYRYGATVDPVWYNCYEPTQVWIDGSIGCRFHRFSTDPTLLWTSLWRLSLATSAPAPDSIGVIVDGRNLVGITSAEDGSGFAVSTGVPRSDGFLDDCHTQFYTLPSSGPAVADPTLHVYGAAKCDWLYWEGGFGATRQQLTSAPSSSPDGFALQARLARTVPR